MIVGKRWRDSKTYHTDKDCSRLSDHAKPRLASDEEREEIKSREDITECTYCSGEANPVSAGHPDSLRAKLERGDIDLD